MTAIFKRDFRSLYTSPVGYVFSGMIVMIMYMLFYLFNVYANKTCDLSLVMSWVLLTLFIPVPILTMRLMTDEYRQQTDQLLLTSPVNVFGIVLGKFFAGMASFGVTIVASFAIPVIIGIFGELNFWIVFGNYVALIAAAGAFIAVALFISSLTENPLVSIVANWVVGIVMLLLNASSSSITWPWLKNVVDWVSPYQRFQSFTVGIFSLSDFVYFISIIVVFLFLTSRILEKKRYS